MTAGIGVRKILDPKRCWKEWMRLGSLNKVLDLFDSEGIKNPKTMRVPTISAIEKAAYRWALGNLSESKEDLVYAWKTEGIFMTEEMWREFLYKKARLAYFLQPIKRKRFLEENGLV